MKLPQTFPIALFLSIWTFPAVTRAQPDERRERERPDGTIGIGFGALLYAPAVGTAGVGVLGAPHQAVVVEPRLSEDFAPRATFSGAY